MPAFNATFLSLSAVRLDSIRNVKIAIKGSRWALKMGENKVNRIGLLCNDKRVSCTTLQNIFLS